MKDEAELKILMGVECKILIGDVVSYEIYNQPHPPKANFVKRLAIKKIFFLNTFLHDFLFLTLQFSMNDLFMLFISS